MKSISKPTLRDDSSNNLRCESASKLCPMQSVKKLACNLTNDQVDDFLQLEKKKLLRINNRDQNLYLNTIVLKEVMQHAESHFVYGTTEQRQALKDEAILLLMVEYYENNEDVLRRFQELVIKKVSKYGFFRRLCVRIYRSLLKKKVT